MFERFTDRARRSLMLAQQQAGELGHNFIGTEHILLGLLVEGEGVAARALTDLGLTPERARDAVVAIIGAPEVRDVVSGKPPFTPRAKKALELSLREALQLGHNYIGTEHLLLGLLREGGGVSAQVLTQNNISLNTARDAVLKRLAQTTSGRTAVEPSFELGGAGFGGVRGPASKAVRMVGPTAMRLARGLRLSTHHLLLAFFEDGDSMAAKALAELGVTKRRVEDALDQLDINQTSDAPPVPPASRSVMEFDVGAGITVRVSDRELAKQMLGDSARLERLLASLLQLRDATSGKGGVDVKPGDDEDPRDPGDVS